MTTLKDYTNDLVQDILKIPEVQTHFLNDSDKENFEQSLEIIVDSYIENIKERIIG